MGPVATPNRRQVSLRLATWHKAVALRDEIASGTSRRVTITDVIESALDCLADTHQRGAPIPPPNPEPRLTSRLRDQIASILAQFAAHHLPHRRLDRIAFDAQRNSLTVHFQDDDEDPKPILIGPTQTPPS